MRQTIDLNINSKEKLLKRTFNIFDQNLENSFEIFGKIGEGAFGVVLSVESKSTRKLFAIKRMQINGENEFSNNYFKRIQFQAIYWKL